MWIRVLDICGAQIKRRQTSLVEPLRVKYPMPLSEAYSISLSRITFDRIISYNIWMEIIMQPYQSQFIKFALTHNALRFGEFTLKSGRKSPYFFNMGVLSSGGALAQLGQFYAQAILQSDVSFDMLFGPAYKGIPLACATAIAFATHHQRDIGVAYDRKEAKDHGEGGIFIGTPLQGKVLMVDDVITAGTAFRHAKQLIESQAAEVAGVIVALDRQERGLTHRSSIEEIQHTWGIPVISIITLDTLLQFLHENNTVEPAVIDNILTYKAEFGV